MSIINCKCEHIRPKYKDLREWCSDPCNIYIARAGVVFVKNNDGTKERYPKISSVFANPFKIGKDGTREEVIQKYRSYIIEKLDSNLELQTELIDLKNKKLGCWCYPEPCHGNVLLELIPKYFKDKKVYSVDFEDENCIVCNQTCNSLSGYKCSECGNIYCDEHNAEEYTCDCYN